MLLTVAGEPVSTDLPRMNLTYLPGAAGTSLFEYPTLYRLQVRAEYMDDDSIHSGTDMVEVGGETFHLDTLQAAGAGRGANCNPIGGIGLG
jgi:hypothetical protein